MIATKCWRKFFIGMMIALLWFGPLNAQQSPAAQTSTAKTSKHSKVKPKQDSREFTLVGAGDIAWCGNLLGAEATAKLIEKLPGATVFAAGDLVYEQGTWEEFQNCYQPTWGKFKDRTMPAPGNHEYQGSPATGYFRYWGEKAGDPLKGYYSYDQGDWHVVVLNTNCGVKALGGCGEGSPEEVWLRGDLAAHASACIIAYGHHSLFSSGILPSHAVHPELRAFWRDLYRAHADLVLAGHEHSYERFAPQTPDGQLDTKNGIRQIVVGTGGKSHTILGFATANSEVRNADTFGVLKLTLSPKSYRWEFIPQLGMTFTDSGKGTCHNHEIAK
jgi:acid phosphatase type 7